MVYSPTKCVYFQLDLPSIHSYFSQHGRVVNLCPGKANNCSGRLHHVIVQFDSEMAVQQVLCQRHHNIPVAGSQPPASQHVRVIERKFKARERSPSPLKIPALQHDQVMERLGNKTDCEAQLTELVEQLALGPEEVQKRVDICKHIQKTFSPKSGRQVEYAECNVFPFGSSINGLGFPGCDLDIFLELGAPRAPPSEFTQSSLRLRQLFV